MKPIIYPYALVSESATLLARKLGTKKVKSNGNYRYFSNHLIINYGNSAAPKWNVAGAKILNHWSKIAVSHNKLRVLAKFRDNGINTIEFSSSRDKAIEWINAGKVVLCRTLLNSKSGNGIVIARNLNEIVPAPLYCVYKKKKSEYRIIVVNGVVVDMMEKRRKTNWEQENQTKVNNLIRTHEQGWVFCREHLNVPNCVIVEAKKALAVLELNFAGIDIIYNENENKAYILEANSAIGLEPEGTTLERLSNAFKSICQNLPIQPITNV